MGQPKVTYNLMGQGFTLSFESLHYSSLKQGWKPDIVEFTNPFNGKKTRNRRGWYYHAEIFYEAIKDTDFLLLRDLFNKNTTNTVFYPDDIEVRKFPCDVQVVGLDFEDLYPDHEKGVRITFDSLDRYDSALDYPTNYWGCRTLRFQDDVTWSGHKDALNLADSNDLASFNTLNTNFGNHLAAANPHGATYYTKAEVDSLIVSKIKYAPIVLAANLTGAGDFFNSQGGFITYTITGCDKPIPRDGSLVALTSRVGTVLQSDALNISVKAGDRLAAFSIYDTALRIYILVNKVQAYKQTVAGATVPNLAVLMIDLKL
ncbi:MAG: hypothetical protein M1469_01295 [Bacteroidetes bacterium]|nr:hypothetical protein [Bacteroidota bacterium]